MPPKTPGERCFFERHGPDGWRFVNPSSENVFLKVYLSLDQRTNLQRDYEILVHPHADAVEMREPGEQEWHGYILKYDNPVEWAVKEGSFFSLYNAIVFLNRLIGRLEYYKTHPEQFLPTRGKISIETALVRVRQAIRIFNMSAKILAERRMGKAPLLIEDEYDVQDILHCILKPQFPDITPEEYTPSIANGGKRIDLVIPSARIVIEIKIIFEKSKTSRMVNQLKVDIESYHSHPACAVLLSVSFTILKILLQILKKLSGI